MMNITTKPKYFNKSFGITLPAKWRKKFGLLPGTEAEISFNENLITIKKSEFDSLHNKRIVNLDGAISIPMEIRQIMNLNAGNGYNLYINEENKAIIIIPTEHTSNSELSLLG